MKTNLDLARLLVRKAESDLAELSGIFCPALQALPFDIAEFNPFAVTIRYDDFDDEVSLSLLQEMSDKANQVRSAIIEVLPNVVIYDQR